MKTTSWRRIPGYGSMRFFLVHENEHKMCHEAKHLEIQRLMSTAAQKVHASVRISDTSLALGQRHTELIPCGAFATRLCERAQVCVGGTNGTRREPNMQMQQRADKELIMTAGDTKTVPGRGGDNEAGEVPEVRGVLEPQPARRKNGPVPEDMPGEKVVSPHRYGRKEIEENIRPDPDPDDPVSP
jgi:hypothetical protein